MTIEQLLTPETDAQFLKRVDPLMARRAELLNEMAELGTEWVRLHETEACVDNPETIEAAREAYLRVRAVYNRVDEETIVAETERMLRIARGTVDDGSDATRVTAKLMAFVFGRAAQRFAKFQAAFEAARL